MENIKNKDIGVGGSKTNLNGINFEEKTYLHDWIKAVGYKLEKQGTSTNRTQIFKVYKDEKFIAWYGRQGQIYKELKEEYPDKVNDKHLKKVLSKKINPDAFILNKEKNTLIIFEKKWQQSSGSVDEKIQTAPFKLAMFEKLLRGTGIHLMYHYILSDWFKKSAYRNVKEYYEDKDKIEIWIEKENLDKLDITLYL